MDPIAESKKNRDRAGVVLRALGRDMKLDMNVVRSILVWVEENQKTAWAEFRHVPVEGASEEAVAYHVARMASEGFLDARTQVVGGTEPDELYVVYSINGISWAGHDLIEYLREPSGVERAVRLAKSVGEGGLGAVYKALEGEAVERIVSYVKGLAQ